MNITTVEHEGKHYLYCGQCGHRGGALSVTHDVTCALVKECHGKPPFTTDIDAIRSDLIAIAKTAAKTEGRTVFHMLSSATRYMRSASIMTQIDAEQTRLRARELWTRKDLKSEEHVRDVQDVLSCFYKPAYDLVTEYMAVDALCRQEGRVDKAIPLVVSWTNPQMLWFETQILADICLIFSTLNLSPFVLMWIIDYLPEFTHKKPLDKFA